MNGWSLDPEGIFLNHGSFGACPTDILGEQQRLRSELEASPVPFTLERLPLLLERARRETASFFGADPSRFLFVKNATTGVNTVLAGLDPTGGKELLLTSYGYPACGKAVERWWCGRGGTVRVVDLPLPPPSDAHLTELIVAGVRDTTEVVLLDHITSSTAVCLPLEEICAKVSRPGLTLLVDGAHAPGTVPLDLEALGRCGVTFYTGNLHKWCCSPKGAAFLWANPAMKMELHPLVTSHGWQAGLHSEFDWTGTDDPTAWLVVPACLKWLAEQREGGWPEIRTECRSLLEYGMEEVASALGVQVMGRGTPFMESLELPYKLYHPQLRSSLWREHRIDIHVEAPTQNYPPILRLSAFLYNRASDYRRLADLFRHLLRP